MTFSTSTERFANTGLKEIRRCDDDNNNEYTTFEGKNPKCIKATN